VRAILRSLRDECAEKRRSKGAVSKGE
jgi:hypothetical protein